MSTAEKICEKAKSLPEPLQTEAFHYVDFLISKLTSQVEDAEWTAFSANQLEKQYSAADATYDSD